MILLFYVLGSIALILWVAYPLLQPHTIRHSSDDELLAERTQSLLAALKKLYNQQAQTELAGNKDDSKNIENTLMLQLARIYKSRGIQPVTPPTVVENDADDDADDHEKAATTKAGFCPDCGAAHQRTFRFCPKCGSRQVA